MKKYVNFKFSKETKSDFINFLTFLVMFFVFQSGFAQDVSREISDLMENQIKPILNVIVGAALVISGIYAGILFFQGKKEGLKIVGYIVAGALVVKFISVIALNIIDN